MDSQGGRALNGSPADIVLAGYLTKSGRSLGLSVKRWYALTADAVLTWYKDKKSKDPKGAVTILLCHITIRPAEAKEPSKLVITSTTSEPMILWSEEKDPDTKKWFEALKRCETPTLSNHQKSDANSAHAQEPALDALGAVDVQTISANASPADPSNAHAIRRAVELYNTPVKSNKSSKFLLALGISSSSPLAWIAEHIAKPPLPPDWEKLKDEKKRTYYANAALSQSSWEHPLLFYWPWLCRIFSKMLPVDSNTSAPVAPEEIIDFLINESNLLAELNLEPECLPMHDLKSLQRRVSCDALFYYTWLFSSKQGRNPHLKLSEEHLWDPELVRSVAEYYGIDLAAEPHLIWLPKLALVAPLPPFWTSSDDENGDTLFYCIVSSYCTQGHPVDRYVTLLLQQSRLNMKLENHCAAVRAGWFDILNDEGTRTWYNMATQESSAKAPTGWDDAHERRLQASWNLDIETLVLSLCHIRAQQGLQPEWLVPPSISVTVAQTEDAAAHPTAPFTPTNVAVAAGDVSFALEDSFAGANGDEAVRPMQEALFSPGDEVQDDGSISGSEDDSDVAENELLLLPQDTHIELQTPLQRQIYPETSCNRSMQTSPVGFRAPEVESTSYFVDGFSMIGAVRSGANAAHSIGVQCSLRPQCADASCSASFAPSNAVSVTNATEEHGVDSMLQPHSAESQHVIAEQLKVTFQVFRLCSLNLTFIHESLQVIEDLKRQVELLGRSDSQLPQLHDPLEQSRARAAKKRDAGALRPHCTACRRRMFYSQQFFIAPWCVSIVKQLAHIVVSDARCSPVAGPRADGSPPPPAPGAAARQPSDPTAAVGPAARAVKISSVNVDTAPQPPSHAARPPPPPPPPPPRAATAAATAAGLRRSAARCSSRGACCGSRQCWRRTRTWRARSTKHCCARWRRERRR